MQEYETQNIDVTPTAPVAEVLGRELPPGFGLGSFEIVSVLRQSAQAIIYRGRDVMSGGAVTIYENLPTAYAKREHNREWVTALNERLVPDYNATLEDFRNRAVAAARLEHANIAAVRSVFKARGTVYAVADTLAGEELAVALSEPEKVNQAVLHPLLYDLLGALDYMHGRGLLHGNISPRTVRLRVDGTPVISDFCMMVDLAESTFGYVPKVGECTSPELAVQGNTPDSRADLYSLAATCYRLITGSRVPRCTDRSSGKSAYQPLAGRRDLQQRFRYEFLQGIDRALEMEPDKRWPNAQEWRLALGKPAANAAVKRGFKIDAVNLGAREFADCGSVECSPVYVDRQHRRVSCGELMLGAAVVALLVTVSGWLWFLSSELLVAFGEAGNTAGVKLLLNIPGADSDSPAADGRTPLIAAVQSGNPATVRLFLDDKAVDVNRGDSRGRTALHVAAEQGNIDMVRLLLAEPTIDRSKADKKGATPFKVAEMNGHQSIARLLRVGKKKPVRGTGTRR